MVTGGSEDTLKALSQTLDQQSWSESLTACTTVSVSHLLYSVCTQTARVTVSWNMSGGQKIDGG